MNGIRERHSNYPAFCGGTVKSSWNAGQSVEGLMAGQLKATGMQEGCRGMMAGRASLKDLADFWRDGG